MSPVATEFPGHRADTPMLWALFALATLETFVVHLFLWLKWPAVASVLTLLSAGFLIWLVRLIRSLKTCPHCLDGDTLRLRMGSFKRFDIGLSQVARVRRSWASGEADAPGTASLVLMAAPNRLVELSSPVPGRRRPIGAVAISVNDPGAFDDALAARGIVIG